MKEEIDKIETYREQYEKGEREPGKNFSVQNAGIILLHPFLQTYFVKTKLMQDGKLIDIDKQYRAAYLLQYAAFGRTDASKDGLALNKILCGIDPEKALPAPPQITEEEQAITNEMIKALLARWKKMGNTSPDRFRVSFFNGPAY